LGWPAFLRELSVREIYDSAEAKYFPRALSDVHVLLVRADSNKLNDVADTPYREIYSDDKLGWSSICPKIEVIDVAGGHSSILQEPFVESLGSALTAILNHDSAAASESVPSVVPLESCQPDTYVKPAGAHCNEYPVSSNFQG
jgi:thioesterase domain-containing protein